MSATPRVRHTGTTAKHANFAVQGPEADIREIALRSMNLGLGLRTTDVHPDSQMLLVTLIKIHSAIVEYFPSFIEILTKFPFLGSAGKTENILR